MDSKRIDFVHTHMCGEGASLYYLGADFAYDGKQVFVARVQTKEINFCWNQIRIISFVEQ